MAACVPANGITQCIECELWPVNGEKTQENQTLWNERKKHTEWSLRGDLTWLWLGAFQRRGSPPGEQRWRESCRCFLQLSRRAMDPQPGGPAARTHSPSALLSFLLRSRNM